MPRTSARVVLLCGALGLACGPKEVEEGSGTATTSGPGGTSGAATTSTGTGATDAPTTDAPTTDAPTTDASTTDAPTTDAPTTDASTTEVSGTSSGASGTTGDACEDLGDVVPGPAVEITLANEGTDAVFLSHVSSCAAVPLIDVLGPDSDAPIQWMHDVCQITCGQAIQGACACPPFCPVDTVLMIAPGGQHTFLWDGAALREVPLPLPCAAECGDACLKVEQAEPGSYDLVARASTSAVACADPNMCTCDPNPDGWCDVQASGIGAELRVAEAILDYPNTTAITLTFTD